MCRSLDELKQRGIEEGLLQGEIRGIEKGKILGIQEGEMIGIQKGKTLGIQQNLIQLLNSKLGNISKELILEIKKSDEERLNELVIRIFDVNNEEDIYEILN